MKKENIAFTCFHAELIGKLRLIPSDALKCGRSYRAIKNRIVPKIPKAIRVSIMLTKVIRNITDLIKKMVSLKAIYLNSLGHHFYFALVLPCLVLPTSSMSQVFVISFKSGERLRRSFLSI